MGIRITEILPIKEIEIEELAGKIIAIDAPIFLYQFLTTIRQRDGSLLKDSHGNITSHLSGIFFRTIKLIEANIKPVYIFDGKKPELKKAEQERRNAIKKEARTLYEKAVQEEDIESMKKYASRTTSLTSDMIDEARELITLLGIPIVIGDSEAEAQAANLVKRGNAFAVASQDADALLFGSDKLIRNLSLYGKRKKPNKLVFEVVRPQLITLSDTLKTLGISHEQFIVLAMLVGTDYNPDGIKGIGPKNALKIVKKYGDNIEMVFKETQWSKSFNTQWQEIFHLIKNMPINNNYQLEWKPIDKKKLIAFLVDKHDFSEERITTSLETLYNGKKTAQKSLSTFFN